jgi:ketosteroid isomerase-like protein
MKANIFLVTLLLIILGGCTSPQSDQLTQQEKEQIKNEIKSVSDSIFEKTKRLDTTVIAQYYSPHLVVVRDTLLFNYQAWNKGWADYMNYIATFNWTPIHWECIIIAKDLAISSLVGKMEYTLKSGDKNTIDPIGYAYVWKKIDGQWKIIYENYSGVHVTQTADNK